MRISSTFSMNCGKYFSFNTKLNKIYCKSKRNFASIFVVRNEMKQNFAYFCFAKQAKQARLSYHFMFRKIFKKAKIKNPIKGLANRECREIS